MKNRIPKNPIKKKRLEKKLKKLKVEGRLVKGVVIPKGSLAGDPDKQNRGNGYAAKFYYVDISFFCNGCGNKEVWTAKQQQKYFETQKGNIYNKPKWCYECHNKQMAKKYVKVVKKV